MKYLLSVHHRVTSNGDYELSIPEGVQTDDLFTAVAALNADLGHAGAWVFAGGLRPPSEGNLVDSNGPEIVIADSPHANAKDFLGGFWVIETKDRETALDWACRASAACRQEVDVRPFQG